MVEISAYYLNEDFSKAILPAYYCCNCLVNCGRIKMASPVGEGYSKTAKELVHFRYGLQGCAE
ncbi:MAG: hypothetical protein H6629_17390 [Calditrichae bacterium]|nr:hypothetical protein [Calditrichia bacterium]